MRWLLLLLALLAGSAWGQERRDPWIPPHAKASPDYVETRGAALRLQVERKLRAQFDAADMAKSGWITREQARAAGLGYIADNFDAIDVNRAGAVTFDDVKRYLEMP